MKKIHQKTLKKTLLKAILEITFRERNLFEEIDDVITTLIKKNGIEMKISYFDQSQRRLKFVALKGQHGPEGKRENQPIKI